jgi:hypothetical protein
LAAEPQTQQHRAYDFRFGIEYFRGTTIVTSIYFGRSYHTFEIPGIFNEKAVEISNALEAGIRQIVKDHAGFSMTTPNLDYCLQ